MNTRPGLRSASIRPNDRKILTLIRFDGSLEDLQRRLTDLVHPDSVDRLAMIVESTDLESIYVQQPAEI